MRLKTSLFRATAITVTALTLSVSSAASAATYVLTQLSADDLDLGSLTVNSGEFRNSGDTILIRQ